MSDPIESVTQVTEASASNSNQANLMYELEMQDIMNTNFSQQVNQTYQSSMKSLAQSTDDPALSSSVSSFTI